MGISNTLCVVDTAITHEDFIRLPEGPRALTLLHLPGRIIHSMWDLFDDKILITVNAITFWIDKLKADNVWLPDDIETISKEWCTITKGPGYFLASLYDELSVHHFLNFLDRLTVLYDMNRKLMEYQSTTGIPFLVDNLIPQPQDALDKIRRLRLIIDQVRYSVIVSSKRQLTRRRIRNQLPNYVNPAIIHVDFSSLNLIKAQEGDIIYTNICKYYVVGEGNYIRFDRDLPIDIIPYLKTHGIVTVELFNQVYYDMYRNVAELIQKVS